MLSQGCGRLGAKISSLTLLNGPVGLLCPVEQLLLFTEVCVRHLSVSCLTCPLSAGSFSLVLPEAHPSPLSVLSTSREGRERESPATQGKIRGLPLLSHVESPSALRQSGKPFVGVTVLPYL